MEDSSFILSIIYAIILILIIKGVVEVSTTYVWTNALLLTLLFAYWFLIPKDITTTDTTSSAAVNYKRLTGEWVTFTYVTEYRPATFIVSTGLFAILPIIAFYKFKNKGSLEDKEPAPKRGRPKIQQKK